MIKQTYSEWVQEGTEKFGPERKNWKFICPKCGHVQAPLQFHELNLKGDDALFDCIGRHVEGRGCNWAAYGLFGTLGRGRDIVFPDREKPVEIFDFAPIELQNITIEATIEE